MELQCFQRPSAKKILLPRGARATKLLGSELTLGSTGGLSQWRNSRPAFLQLPTARGISLARISREVKSVFKELFRVLNARDLSHATSPTCDVTYGRLILPLLDLRHAPPSELLF